MEIEPINENEIVDIDLGVNNEVLPTKHDKIALIDADTIAFTSCLSTEVASEVLPRDFYSDEEWEEIQNSPHYDEENSMVYLIDLELALEKATDKIQSILDKTGCRTAELHFTSGRKSFRYDIYPEYKAHRRTQRTPAGIADLKKMLCEKYEGYIHQDYEADDVVVYLYKNNPNEYILVALDKDVLNSVEGTHWNYYESAVHNIQMRWYFVDSKTAMMWPYIQTLTGDKTDNIIGLHRVGNKKALKILNGCMSERCMWDAVVAEYSKHDRPEEDALLNYNLVSMHLLTKCDEHDTCEQCKYEGLKIQLKEI